MTGQLNDAVIDIFYRTSYGDSKTLRMSGNRLTGTIPANLFYLFQYVDLSAQDDGVSTGLTGSIPPIAPNATQIHLDLNRLSGTLPPSFYTATSLTNFTIRDNTLGGTIGDISNMASLVYLDLHGNNFVGTIPPSMWTGNLAPCTLR
eukprot:TRINITY_DN8645_c0_g1_i2.p1 TRINITY_DN8645_c0_g1~~TRINITY_DN8645_c0_g1_i2.p1  ORF type:complete len:147 (-),score=14.34 TRINITY_DN8645_c0_g1_i2:18-458(-)